jgi:hypothetical protein
MNTSDVIHNLLLERASIKEKARQLYNWTHRTNSNLNPAYDLLAEKIRNEIPGFEDVAEALLTAEKTRKIDPQVLLRLWAAILEFFPQLISLDEVWSQPLKKHLLTLCQQEIDQKFDTPQWITEKIRKLPKGSGFTLLLPTSTPFGKSLENVVVYQKNADETWNLLFFHAKKDSWNLQGGMQGVGYEKNYSVLYYSQVPEEDLFGPHFNGDTALHAKILVQAGSDLNPPENTWESVLKPLAAYLTPPDKNFYQVQTAHAHPLKAMNAYLFFCMKERIGVEAIALQGYKAFMCIFRLVLSLSLRKTDLKKDYDQHQSHLGLAVTAARSTAHYLNKQSHQPGLKELYEEAAGSLEELKVWAEKNQRTFIPPDKSLSQRQMAANQTELMKMGLKESQLFFDNANQKALQKKENPVLSNEYVNAADPPQDPALLVAWLNQREIHIQAVEKDYPDLVIPALNSCLSKLELPRENNVWFKMQKSEALQALQTLHVLSERLSRHAFQQNLRFSLEVQNSGARVLLAGQALAEILDETHVLKGFIPALKGYKKLTASPYFRADPFEAWQQRQEILRFAKEQEASGRQRIWHFSSKGKVDYEKTAEGNLAEALLNSHPKIEQAIEEQLRHLRQRKKSDDWICFVSGQWLLTKLLNLKVQGPFDLKLDLKNFSIESYAYLAQIAMHIHLLSDPRAQLQIGYENQVSLKSHGFSFDLTYAKQYQNPIDFQQEASNSKYKINLSRRNLLPQEKWNENQNKTLLRLTKNEDTPKALFYLEEAAAEPSLTILQLLHHFKTGLAELNNSEVRHFFESYLFKVHVSKEGTESCPLQDEMLQYPRVFNLQLREFLDISKILIKNQELGSASWEFLFALSLRLRTMAQKISCEPVLQTLRRFQHYLDHEKIKNPRSGNLKLLLLKNLSSAGDWTQYFLWGKTLQKQLDQKEIVLDLAALSEWNRLRWNRAFLFQKLQKEQPQVLKDLALEENFDVLSMSCGKGKWQPVPASILQHPEFIKLFGDRVRFWKVDELGQTTFSDPRGGHYGLKNMDAFPQQLWRWIDNEPYLFIPEQAASSILHIPPAIQQESFWWVNSSEAKGYHKEKPDTIWLERDQEGGIVFKEGIEKGMRLELVNEASSSSSLEAQWGILGLHYYAYRPRTVQNRLIEYRDLLVFPYVRMPHGQSMVFERNREAFYERNNPERKLIDYLFAPSSSTVATALRFYGIKTEKIQKDTLRNEKAVTVWVPFQRYVADAHSSVIRPLVKAWDSRSHQSSQMTDVMEIQIDHQGLCPENAQGLLMAAYLSLVGKAYHDAARFLKKIRPNHCLDALEITLLRWLIDSSEDAHDHSASAAAIKLLAYILWGEQGRPPSGEILAADFPRDSLEGIYGDYLNHLASVPSPLRLSETQERWILDQGFHLFPSSKMDSKYKEWRKEELTTGCKKVQIFHLPSASRKLLLARWKEPILSEALQTLEVSAVLVEGIAFLAPQTLLTGRPYPLGSFGYHYQQLSSGELSEQDKWELIYTLETTTIPSFLKASLQYAFQKGKETLPLPKLGHKLRLEKIRLTEEWFKQLLKDEKALPCPKKNEMQVDELPKHNKEMFVEKDFAKQIFSMIQEGKKMTFTALLESLRSTSASNFKAAPYVELSCPFVPEQTADPFFKKELEFYKKEFQKGAELQKQARFYLVPSLEKIKELNKILEYFSKELDVAPLENQILSVVNRRSIDSRGISKSLLTEVMEHKVAITIDEALKTIFFREDKPKLAYLQKLNPFLVEEDLASLHIALQDYLEGCINDTTLVQLKEKIQHILSCSENDQGWITQPSVEQAWQEAAELLNPFVQYPKNPQAHLERLLFEYHCGFRIKSAQFNILNLLIEKIFNQNIQETDRLFIFQMLMGEGKSSVIMAQAALLAARNDKVPIFLAHHSQHASLKANLVNTQFKRLNQDVIDLDFKREDLSSIKILRHINLQFTHAALKGHLILMKTNFLLVILLEFVEQIKALKDLQNRDPFNLERIQELAKILIFIKKKSLVLGDEVDWILNILEEITFPAGGSVVISESSLELIKQIYVTLSTHPKIAPLLKLVQDDQALVAKEKVRNEIFPDLVETLIHDYPPLSDLLPAKKYTIYQGALKDYILGRIDPRLSDGVSVADSDSFLDSLKISNEKEREQAAIHLDFLRHLFALKGKPSSHAAALAKELCTEILPITLGKSYNRNYGFMEDGKLIPFFGVGCPNYTEFANIYVTTCCYLQAGLQKGVDSGRFLRYRDMLREASLYYSELFHCPPEESAEAQHFLTLTGLELHRECSDLDFQTTIKEMNGDPQRCLDFYTEFSSLHLKYHTSLLNCGPIALAHLIGPFIGCSATLWNQETFERKIAEKCFLQEGTEGRIIFKIAQDIALKKSFLITLDQPDPQSILKVVLNKRGNEAAERLRTLIDASGILKRFSNDQVAQEILNFEPLKEQIDGVVYLHKEGRKEAFSLLKRGMEKPIPLSTTSRKEIEKHGVRLERVFVYFDELRATGSDIPFKPDGIAVQTFDPFTTSMRTDLQAHLRARQFFYAQNVDLIIQKETLEGMVGYDSKSPEACLQAPNIFHTSVRNQSKLKQTLLLRSALEQVREIFCSPIVQELVRAFSNPQKDFIDVKKLELFYSAEWLFYHSFKDDPASLFLDLQKETPAYVVVERYLNQIKQRFDDSCGCYLDSSISNLIAENIKKILQWSREQLIWNVSHANTNTHLEKQVFVQKQNENQLEVNAEIQKETQKELQKYAVRVDAPAADYIPWKCQKEIPSVFSDYQKPDIMTFRQLLQTVDIYEAPYDRIFPEDLYLTENLARSHAVDLPVFHRAQKKTYHLLLVQEAKSFSTLFIDLKEAAFWRKQMQKFPLKDCWLCDLDGHDLNERSPPQEALTVLKRAQWWGQFFNGNVGYLRGHPTLVQQEFKRENEELKYRYLVLKTAHHSLQSKILKLDPLFSNMSSKKADFPLALKKEENEWMAGIDEELNPDKLNQLPLNFARYFSSRQIPLLKRAGFFSYLPLEKFEYVLPSQVGLIPNHRLQHLCRSEQIAVVPDKKICFLKGKALEHLQEKDLHLINPAVLNQLKPGLQEKYQQQQIQKMGLEAFGKTVLPCMAPAILPECVKHISDDCLPFVTTYKQLAEFPSSKYHLLKAHQLHLVPQDNWCLFQREDYQVYEQEEKIPLEAKEFIRQMNADWVNDVDPRLAQFFEEKQVRKINQPKPISYLQEEQLAWLEASLAEYLEPHQLAALTAKHRHLIETFLDPKRLSQLSSEGLCEISIAQACKIDDPGIIRRLDARFFPHLSSRQIKCLQTSHKKDLEIIRCLTREQLIKLSSQDILKILPHLNDNALRSIKPSLLCDLETLSYESRQKLTAHQMQCFMIGQSKRKADILTFVKEIREDQWQGFDRIFVESYFVNRPSQVIRCVPKSQRLFLAKEALFQWYGVDSRPKNILDRITGLCASLCYPLVLLCALMFGLCNSKKKGFLKSFLFLALAPLRFIDRESYYRIISEKIERENN